MSKKGYIFIVIAILVAMALIATVETGFMDVVVLNPDSAELEEAFVLYEGKTGKDRNDMSYYDIANYVSMIREFQTKEEK